MQLRRAKERAIRLQQSDIREVTSGMNPAQKRRWNAYSTRKKQRLFGQARRAVKRKRRYQRVIVNPKNENYTERMESSLRIWQEELPEHLDAPVRRETVLEEQRWGRERSEYRTAAFKKSTPEENDRGSSQKRVETQTTTVSWQSREGLRQKAPETDSRPPNRIEKRRDRKSESTIRELLGLIDRDIRRTEGIKQEISSEQIQMSEAGYETAKTVAATSLIPLRLRYERMRRDVRIRNAAGGILAGQVFDTIIRAILSGRPFICNPDGTDRGTRRKRSRGVNLWSFKRGIRVRDRRLCPRMDRCHALCLGCRTKLCNRLAGLCGLQFVCAWRVCTFGL